MSLDEQAVSLDFHWFTILSSRNLYILEQVGRQYLLDRSTAYRGTGNDVAFGSQ